MRKSNSKFYLVPLKLLTNFEKPSSNPLQDPTAAVLTLKMRTGSRLWFCKIIPEAACDKLIFAHFPAANERSALENIDQSQRREFEEGFSKHFQN